MKKVSLILGIGAMMLASCSNDGLVVNNAEKANYQAPINLGMRVGNQSRDEDPTYKQLEALNKHEFGVFAYKANQASDIDRASAITVMDNYLVGYWNGTLGYKRAAGTYNDAAYTSAVRDWFYEGLGSADNAEYSATGVDESWVAANKAKEDHQYLKYWDTEYDYTYFYGYVPYDKDKVTTSVENNKVVLNFPNVTAATAGDYMWAFTKIQNSTMIPAAGTTLADYDKTVTMKFYRAQSRIRVAFWGEVDGYDVEIVDFATSNKATVTAQTGVIARPAKYDEGAYSAGKLTTSGKTKVTFGETEADAVVTYDSATKDGNDIVFACPMNRGTDQNLTAVAATPDDLDGDGTNEDHYYINPSRTNRIGSDWVNVLPNDQTNANDGLTFNITLRFVAKDTKEVSYYHSHIYAGPQYTNWKSNTQYVYIFKIAKNVKGGTPVPGVTPDPDPALWPIIFDDVIVSDWTNVTDHYDWNYGSPEDENGWRDNVGH